MQYQWGVQGASLFSPFRVKNKRTRKEEKPAEQAKQNHPSPGLKPPLNTLTNTIFYGSNSSSMIKQLLKLNWLSQNEVFVSVLHIIMETIIMYNHLRTWTVVQYSLHKSFFTCMMTSACFFSHVGKAEKMCWAKVKHSHSNTTASISFRVNCIVESILSTLLLLSPRCNRYCLRNSFI